MSCGVARPAHFRVNEIACKKPRSGWKCRFLSVNKAVTVTPVLSMPLFYIFCVMFPLSIIHSLNILYHQPLSFSITFNEFCVACAFASIVRQVDLNSKIFFSDCLLLNTSLSLEHLCVNFHFFWIFFLSISFTSLSLYITMSI